MKKIIRFLLMYFTRCHGLESRCFKINGKPMPICARCTGILIGYPIAMCTLLYIGFSPFILLLIIPMGFDGLYQLINREYESNNIKRVITGFFGSFTIIYIIYFICLGLNEVAYFILDSLRIPYKRF